MQKSSSEFDFDNHSTEASQASSVNSDRPLVDSSDNLTSGACSVLAKKTYYDYDIIERFENLDDGVSYLKKKN